MGPALSTGSRECEDKPLFAAGLKRAERNFGRWRSSRACGGGTPCPTKAQTQGWGDPRGDAGWEGRGGAKPSPAVAAPLAPGGIARASPRVSRDNPSATLRGRGDGYSDSRPRGHGRLLQGPIESLGGPVCKYEGRADPRLGGAQVGGPGTRSVAANGSLAPC